MKLNEHIANSIVQYPTLYVSSDFQFSRLKVLDHLFLTIGNGYDWAETDNPREGGYLIEPCSVKDENDDWVKLMDPQYGLHTLSKNSPSTGNISTLTKRLL